MSNDPVPTPTPYLDPQCVAFGEQAAKLSKGASLSSLSLREFRRLFRQFQTPTPKDPGISSSSFEVKTSFGDVKTFIVKPTDAEQDLPVIFYVHGGGWFGGSEFDFESLLFDLVHRTGFAIVFPQYTLAPEEQFPAQQEQCLEVLQWVVKHGHTKGLKNDKFALAADSAGGQIVTAISILNHQRDLGLPIVHQILMFPFVNSVSLTSTFSQFLFQDGPLINIAFAAESFKDYYGDKIKERSSITASPILMTPAQAKEFMPSTTIVTAQNDFLRDQGEDFAKLLQTAGVDCGVVQGVAILHDAVVFNLSRTSPTVELIMIMVAGKLREVLTPGVGNDLSTNSHAEGEENGHSHKRKKRS
ncbi:hypothetical protein LTS07_003598 [Exophiala sideris]|uniref:Alpha/beta hydrolase fold-3 domain-containing protein n=1 Tax=Exophiala sideris TaxID=1016849 RepID=A0ABR0JGK2_9EURO|nr:hypothetical protein LTS07_003598 [Exophiala sideris]KAK5042206.1 hypothetical protein LTR13_002012 [Exophiala sideris]KAK5063840.1 hypothetical protein LTR69_003606 [Exophiala sideris]KAK5185474.1 hypothetical protein LTR44_002463 [Eurotiomycetes sp. CCFEE 6388]